MTVDFEGRRLSFIDRYLEVLRSDYPRVGSHAELRERFSPQLVCPSVIELPTSLADSARRIVAALFALRQSEKYRSFIADKLRNAKRPVFDDPGNFSALSCLDFHSTTDGKLKLVEYNTNASMSLICDLLYKAHKLPNIFSHDFLDEIMTTFSDEAEVQGRDKGTLAIVDEKPEGQRLFLEFELYRELFERSGWRALIADASELSHTGGHLFAGDLKVDLVYNRHTDFYFETSATAALGQAFREKSATVTPNAFEYMLLADKERMQDLTPFIEDEGLELEARFGLVRKQSVEIARTVLRTHDIGAFPTVEDAWAERKKYFFKPKRSFGGKAVYRGNTVSRTVFEAQILKNEYIAQELAPPPTVLLSAGDDQPGGEFKYDLRFFVYRDKIQMACARLYQGQTTNSQTLGGGVAAIRWV